MRRRQWLKLGFWGTVMVAGGASLVRGLMPGTSGPKAMWLAVARAVLKDALPAGRAGESALESHWGRLEGTLAGLAPATRAELDELTQLLASPLGRWALLGLTQIFRALRDLTNAAYFSDESSWGVMGYPGPLLVEVI